MFGIVIAYDYSGDEAAWSEAVDAFVRHIDADPRLSGRFTYQVNVAAEGNGRVHIGRWDSEDTLKHLQGQDWFKTFAGQVQAFAGDTLKATRFRRVNGTAGT